MNTTMLISKILSEFPNPEKIYWLDEDYGQVVGGRDLRISFEEPDEGFHVGSQVVRFSSYTYAGTSTVHQYEDIPYYDYKGIPEWFYQLLTEEQ
jgi:hypothetical protein